MSPDLISVVYTPGSKCGFACRMCDVARMVWLEEGYLRDLQIVTPKDVELVNRRFAGRGKRIAFQKIAGVAGDAFFLDNNPTWDLEGVIDVMIDGLNEPERPQDTMVGGRIHIVSTMVDVTEKAASKLEKKKDYILCQLSVGKHHYNGGKRFCTQEYESLTEMVNDGHIYSCEYFRRTKVGVEILKSVVGMDNIVTLTINNSGEEDFETLNTFVRGFYGITLKDEEKKSMRTANLSTPVSPAIPGSEKTAISDKPSNNNLQFVTREAGMLRFYGSYRLLLTHDFYDEISATL